MTETFKQLDSDKLEVTTTEEYKEVYDKASLLAQKARIENLLSQFKD